MRQDVLHLFILLSPRRMGKFSRLLVFVSEEVRHIQGEFGKSRQEQCFPAAEKERISHHVHEQAGSHGSPVSTTQ